MGSNVNRDDQHRKYEARYTLDNNRGVHLLLSEYHALIERQFMGDYAAVDILLDLQEAIKRADLTNRQMDVLKLIYFQDLSQVETAKVISVSKQTIHQILRKITSKIAKVYESWAIDEEGYTVSITKNGGY